MGSNTNSAQPKVVQASEILAKIERGEPVEYDGVIVEGDLDLTGFDNVSSSIDIKNSKIFGAVNLDNTIFEKMVIFDYANFSQEARFVGAKFYFGAWFRGAQFSDNAHFEGARFRTYATFEDAQFCDNASFIGARFYNNADFRRARFGSNANFAFTRFSWDILFEEVHFSGDADFRDAQFSRNLTFVDAIFGNPASQEFVCRIAKIKMEELGNKKEADDYFYREMAAIRIQKGRRGVTQSPSNIRERLGLAKSKVFRFLKHDFLEYVFVQGIFGYGVYPSRVIGTWLIMVFVFAFIYCVGKGVIGADSIYECVWFSIATAATPGYAMFRPNGFYQLVSGIEAILGTFLWAAFIATFARKWMR